jgi:hypothetical protein
MKEYIIARLAEASTWRGLVYLLTALGVAMDVAKTEALVAAGMAISGAIAVFVADNKGR